MIRALLIGYFATPLLCWSLLARTKALGWTGAALFAVTGVLAGLMISGWAFGEQNLGQAKTVMKAIVILLLAGVLAERSWPGVRALRTTSRGRAGMRLSLAYCGSMPVLLFVYGISGLVTIAPGTDVLPLASGLVVISDTAGCTADPGGGYDCNRTILARGPQSEPVTDLLRAEVRQLYLVHGWDMTQALSPAMSVGGYGLWQTGMFTRPVVSVTAAHGTLSISLST
jgi:hypothetical protein